MMLTPFNKNKSIDFNALGELTDFYFRKGASGLFANCLSSEMYNLDREEQIVLVKEVIKATQGRIPVIATGTEMNISIEDQADRIKEIYNLGVAAVVIITSHLSDEDQPEDVLKKQFDRLMKSTADIPLGLYECPNPYKRLLSPALAGWLARSGRFLYYKETSCDLAVIRKKIRAIRNTTLGLYNANTPTALDSLLSGGRGLSPISANFYPELYDCLSWISGDNSQQKEARRLQRLLTIMDAVTRIKYPLSAKKFLVKRGLKMKAETRLEIPPLNDEEERMLSALFEQFQEILPEFDL